MLGLGSGRSGWEGYHGQSIPSRYGRKNARRRQAYARGCRDRVLALGAYDPTNKEICVKLPVFVIIIEDRIGSLAVFLVVISADELLKRLRGSIVPADAADMPK